MMKELMKDMMKNIRTITEYGSEIMAGHFCMEFMIFELTLLYLGSGTSKPSYL